MPSEIAEADIRVYKCKIPTARHDGINCVVCGKSSFTGRRYKCLRCSGDYDQCGSCHDALTMSRVLGEDDGDSESEDQDERDGEHTSDHPMQCIFVPADLERYFGGDPISFDRGQSFTCPCCGAKGFEEAALTDHVEQNHANSFIEVYCPICVTMPTVALHATEDLCSHLIRDHQSNGDGGPARRGAPKRALERRARIPAANSTAQDMVEYERTLRQAQEQSRLHHQLEQQEQLAMAEVLAARTAAEYTAGSNASMLPHFDVGAVSAPSAYPGQGTNPPFANPASVIPTFPGFGTQSMQFQDQLFPSSLQPGYTTRLPSSLRPPLTQPLRSGFAASGNFQIQPVLRSPLPAATAPVLSTPIIRDTEYTTTSQQRVSEINNQGFLSTQPNNLRSVYPVYPFLPQIDPSRSGVGPGSGGYMPYPRAMFSYADPRRPGGRPLYSDRDFGVQGRKLGTAHSLLDWLLFYGPASDPQDDSSHRTADRALFVQELLIGTLCDTFDKHDDGGEVVLQSALPVEPGSSCSTD